MIANDLDRVKFLVCKGADVNKVDNQGATPLKAPRAHRHPTRWWSCLSISAPTSMRTRRPTPLIAAVMRDHVPSVKVLLDNGADIEKPGLEVFRPLALAIAEDKYEVAKALMEAGADVNSRPGRTGLTPLMIAVGADLAGRRRHVRAHAARVRSTSRRVCSSAAPT